MSEENTVTINDEQYDFEGLAVETQANIARVNELRQEIGRLQMQISEREVVLQAYTKAIVESVQPVEEVEGEVVN